MRSAQTRELANEAQGPANNGQVSVANELPGATQNAGDNGGSSEQSSTTEETINYEISRVTETEIIEAGAIKRLSVAVVVDGVYESTPEGNATYAPRPQDEINQIRNLVNSTIGYDADRGDQVEVVNMQFANRPELSFEPLNPAFLTLPATTYLQRLRWLLHYLSLWPSYSS